MNGMSLHFVAQRSGVNRSTIRSLLYRHPKLQEMPYSTKAGGARVFLPPFVEWLASHQGADAANVAPPATIATSRPLNGAQMDATIRAADKGLISREQVQILFGLVPEIIMQAPSPGLFPLPADSAMTDARETLGDKGLRQIIAVASRIAKETHDRKDADRKQGRLEI